MTDLPDSMLPGTAGPPASLFENCPFPDHHSYGEAHRSPGQPRDYWQPILSAFELMGPVDLNRRQSHVNRLRHEHGATFNPFGDPNKGSSPWQPDLIPVLIPSEQWKVLETGLVQRARLLNLILADVYGPQQLLKDRRLAPELIFANPDFLRMVHGIQPPRSGFLAFYAADVCRCANGRWMVLNDFSSNPAGLGYALDNRIVVSRVLSHLYHQNRIFRLAPFFSTLQQLLTDSAGNRHPVGRVAILSPGPAATTYFEHAFLSRYLGYPLVECQDLTVRKGKVFVKKLGGLEAVDAIFRCLEDARSDPMAMRTNPAEGVTGLFQAMREGNVALINPVGSGFVETPALQGILPDLCRHLLGEEMLLASRPTWWCGDPAALAHVRERLDELIVRPAWGSPGSKDASGRSLRPGNGAGLRETIEARPHAYAAFEPVAPSFVPAWAGGRVLPRYTILRVFLCATGSGYAVMPGALARISADVDTLLEGSEEKQGSKDVWVLSERPVEQFSLLGGLQTVSEFNRGSDLPSRVAEHLLWLGRYLERAEGMLRLTRSIFRRLSGEVRREYIPELPFLLRVLSKRTGISSILQPLNGSEAHTALEKELVAVVYEKEKTDSIFSILKKVQNTAQKVNDRLSLDSRRTISGLEKLLTMRATDGWDPVSEAQELLNDILFTLSAFSGLAMESMTRGLGWRFMDMGRRIERGLNQVDLIHECLPTDCPDVHSNLEALLEVCDSIMTYLSRYRSAFQFAPVLDLLLVDEANPKSLAFQLVQLHEHVRHLPRRESRRHRAPEERMASEMLAAVRRDDLVRRQDADAEQAGLLLDLKAFLAKMENDLKEFAQQITASYLSRVPATVHFSLTHTELRA